MFYDNGTRRDEYKKKYLFFDTVVGTVNLYALDCPGFRSRWRQVFLYPSGKTLGATQPPVQRVSLRYLGRSVALTTRPHLAARLKKEKSYISTPLSRPVIWRTLRLTHSCYGYSYGRFNLLSVRLK